MLLDSRKKELAWRLPLLLSSLQVTVQVQRTWRSLRMQNLRSRFGTWGAWSFLVGGEQVTGISGMGGKQETILPDPNPIPWQPMAVPG